MYKVKYHYFRVLTMSQLQTESVIQSQVLRATQGQRKTITALLLFITFNSRVQTRQDLL